MLRPSLACVALSLATACSTSTPATTAYDTSAPCYDACRAMVAASCADYPLLTSDDCASGCAAEHTSFPQCRTESDAFYSCIANTGITSCAVVDSEAGALSEPDTSACRAELCARDRCFATASDAGAPTRTCAAVVDAAGE